MGRRRAGLAVLALAAVLAVEGASTASNGVPASTAVHRSTSVSGATLVSLSYTVTAGTITAVTPTLRGTLLLKSVTVRFGSGAAVLCTADLITVLDSLTGLREGRYTCVGLLEDAARPGPMSITVS